MDERIEQARYLKIALDIANRVYHGNLKRAIKSMGDLPWQENTMYLRKP